jgi:ATP-dependent RNA helicase DeaD
MRNKAIICDSIEHVVLDEADQMLDMGFREELEAILEQLPAKRSSHLVSATFPRAVQNLANRFQSNPMVLEGTQLGVANADIQHIGYAIRRHETYPALVNVLLMAGDSRCLLFVNRRVDATELAEKLASDGFGAAPFSGELAQAQRTRTLGAFRNGTLPILVSTEVAARGIDVPGISTVIHVDPPRTPDAYTHRSGRTGRAGQTGRSMIPSPEKVTKALRKQARRELHAHLAEYAPEETQMMYAKQLLEDRDATHVVATLLDMAAPEAARTPMAVTGFDPMTEQGPGRRNDRGAQRSDSRRDSRRDSGGGFDRNPGRDRGPARDRNANAARDFTRFFVSWGEESGATTGRLLSQVCRRGGIESHQVGPIEVTARVSFVGVANDAAAEFEKRAARPDSRDPGIVIRRAEDKSSAGASSRAPQGAAPIGPKGGPRRPGGPGGFKAAGAPRSGSSAPRGPSAPHASHAPPAGPAGGVKDGRRPRADKPKGFKRSGAFKAKGPGHKPGR